jgi:hypothetical protein
LIAEPIQVKLLGDAAAKQSPEDAAVKQSPEDAALKQIRAPEENTVAKQGSGDTVDTAEKRIQEDGAVRQIQSRGGPLWYFCSKECFPL